MSLLSLPNEILLVVFSHLDDPYPLYPLSTLCRRLHFLALPIYLTRMGILCDCPSGESSSTEACNISIRAEKAGALAALQTCLFLNNVQTLSCSFANSFANPQSQIAELARFNRLCSILSSIETVNLQIPPHNDYPEGSQEIYFKNLVQALNTVLEKSCISLAVDATVGDAVSRISKRHRQAPSLEFFTSSISLSPVALRRGTLSTFRLHSEVLFTPYCRPWTLDVLNSFPLTSISIDAPFVPTEVLDALLSETDIPTLSEVSILNCRIKPARMHLFLSRHTSVTWLHLGNAFVPSFEEQLPSGYLPRLTSLSATAAQVAYLLHAMDNTSALRTVRVLSHMTRLDLIFTDTSLHSVASRLGTPVSLTLVLPVPPNLPRVVVDLNLVFGEDTTLKFVATLEFVFEDANVAFFKISDYVSITKWCAPFPGLQTVVLLGFNAEYNMTLIVEAMRLHAPNVEKLVVNSVEYELITPAETQRKAYIVPSV
ncbi:hypothetical protein C8R43DRAFT_1027320 [Mycena crocata]|nr:hypothetical protein C8R43DRAFT_1027320 [Mycena crocata]